MRFLGGTIEWVLILLIAVLFLLRVSAFQTWMGQMATSYYSDELNTKVEIDAVDIRNLRDMKLKGVYIEDLDGDTLVYAQALSADIKKYSIKKEFVDIESIRLNKGRVNLRSLEEGGFNYEFIEDYFASDDTDTSSGGFQVNILNVYLKNTVVSYSVESEDPIANGFDYNHIHGLVNAHISNIRTEDENTLITVNRVRIQEKSGFNVRDLRGELALVPGGFEIDNLHLQTDNSLLLADEFYLKGKSGSWGDFDEFLNRVKLYAHFQEGSNLNIEDLAFFSEDLIGNKMNLKIHGQVRGTVERLRAKDFYLQFEENSFVEGNFDFDGLPDFDNTFMAFNIQEAQTSRGDLQRIELPPYDQSNYIDLPENMGLLGQFSIDGSFMGYYTDFVAFGNINSDMGTIKSDVEFKYSDEYENFFYKGNLEAVDFNIGTMYANAGLSDFGLLSANVSIDTAFGLEIDHLYAQLSGEIKYMDLMGYRYRNFSISNGEFEKDYFIGDIALNDPNIELNYSGKVDFSTSIPKYDFNLSVNNAHLYDLFDFAINEGDDDASVCFTMEVDSAQGNSLDNFTGKINITDFNYHEKGKDVEDIYYINLKSIIDPKTDKRLLDLESDVVDLRVEGDFQYNTLEHSFMKMASDIMPALVPPEEVRTDIDDQFTYELLVKDISAVVDLLDLDLSMTYGSEIRGEYDSKYDIVNLFVESEQIVYGDMRIDALDIDGHLLFDAMDLDIKTDVFQVSEGVEFNEMSMKLTPLPDQIDFELGWDNGNDNAGNFFGTAYIDGQETFEFLLYGSEFTALNKTWKIDDNANIYYNADTVDVSDFNFKSGPEYFNIGGRISPKPEDVLNVKLNDFKLDNLNYLLGMDEMLLYGNTNGHANLSNLYEELRFTSDLYVDSLRINETYVGDIDFESLWNNIDENIAMTGNLLRSEFKTIDFFGKLYPYKEENNLDFTVKFEDTDLGVVNEFLPQDDITEFHAYTNGEIKITGTPEEPKMNGRLNFEEGQFKFVYLNMRYRFDGAIDVAENKISFKDIPLYDEETYYLDLPANGKLNGAILHNNFEDMEFDINVDFNKLKLMDTDLKQNPLFYGQAYATGSVNVFGYGDKINISVIAKTEKGTIFNLPLFGDDDVVLQDFVRFVTHDSVYAEEYKVSLEDITMSFGLDITEEAEVRIIFDPTIGDMMKGSAKGHLSMDINELGKFQMFGDLEVVRGDYLFTMYNVINKKFLIEPGGTIRWQSGDPYEAVVDLTTNYSTKAPLYNLVQLDDEKYKKKSKVNAYMTLKNDLYNPDLSFNIEVPQGDQNVEAALAKLRSDNERITKQFFSLMVINNFISQQAGGYGNAALSATSADLLNNQLSNWLSQLSDEFDIGFHYSPGDQVSHQELALAFETQLLNDRLELSGNFGYQQATTQNNTQLIGDFNVEYKVNEDGTFRIRGFNETNDFDLTNASQARYTQGVGAYYTEEFDKVKDIKIFKKIGKLFRRRKKEVEPEEKQTPTTEGASE